MTNAPRSARGWLSVVSALALVALAGGVWSLSRFPSEARSVERARRALNDGQPVRALTLLETHLQGESPSATMLQVAARAATLTGEFERALGYWRRMPADGSAAAIEADFEAGNLLLLQLSRPTEAASFYRRVLDQQPRHLLANYRMGYLLGLGGRNREATPYRLRLIQIGQVEPLVLNLLCTADTRLENSEELQAMYGVSPHDPLVLLGLARHAMDQQDEPRAEEMLSAVIAAHPEWADAQALLGTLRLNSDSVERFHDWQQQLPASAEDDPDVWALRGRWARSRDQPQAALRCFWETVRLDPNHANANWQVAQLLIAEGRAAEAAPFLARSKQLEKFYDAVTLAWTGQHMAAVEEASRLAEELGLIWESYGWAHLMLNHAPRTRWAQETVQRLRTRLDRLELNRTIDTENPALTLDLSRLPLPEANLSNATKVARSNESRIRNSTGTIRFEDSAEAAGIMFQYFNGSPVNNASRRMYEFNGGGAAVLDFDNDGWPDIYLTQGSHWPPGSASQSHSDRLFRNMGDGRFLDVTDAAGLRESGFSAGVTAGDFDNDGWPDLYVANIGANRFMRNNGDGTFTDVTELSGTAGHSWSTSCVLVDLNADAAPDLYVVNYLTGEDVFERLCPDADGIVRSCSPRDFPAAQDRLYLNLGDGQFEDVTSQWGIDVPNGKGLGIVAADFFNVGRIDLFVANDAVPNFFFSNTPASKQSARFDERALVNGLAMNAEGRSEACMGVAAGDVNGDGQIDLFVTNFYNESNTLYRQQPGMLFDDATRAAGLSAPSLKMLGFGTQFVDADLDGSLDLIVTNGHIDDLSDKGVPYRMPGQFFRGLGDGRFELQDASELGSYFAEPRVGRGLARLDWNRDGRDDALVSHLDAPAALLTNQTESGRHYLSVQLRGVASSRDAIGAVVTIRVGERVLMRQLTAGDGFQCSNERQMVFGLDAEETVQLIDVRWPSGLEQQFESLSADQQVLLIEGESKAYVLERQNEE